MADTGFKSPSETGTPNNDWTTPANAYASDNAYASVIQATGADKNQTYKAFTFGIPAGATINGIEVTIEGYKSAAGTDTMTISLRSIAEGPDSKILTQGTVEGTVTLGGAADLWGSVTWTAAKFANADFRLDTEFPSDDPATGTQFIDHIQVKVYYTEVSSAIKTINGLAKASVKVVNGLAIGSVKTWNSLA